MGADARHVRGAVAADDVLDDLVAHLPVEVEVDVRQVGAPRVQEALHLQPEAQRIDLGDAQQVAHQRVARAAAQRHRVPAAADLARDVAHGQEVAGQPVRLDDRQLLVQPPPRRQVVAQPPVAQAALAVRPQIPHQVERPGQLRLRQDQVARQHVGAEQVGQVVAGPDRLGEVAEAPPQLVGGHEPVLGPDVEKRRYAVEQGVFADGRDGAEGGVLAGADEVRRRAGHRPQAQPAGAGAEFLLVARPARAHHLQPEPAAEGAVQPLGQLRLVHEEVQPFVMRAEHFNNAEVRMRNAEWGRLVCILHVNAANEPAQAAIPRPVRRQRHRAPPAVAQLRPDDRPQPRPRRRLDERHGAVEVVRVRQRQGGVAAGQRVADQHLRAGNTFQQGVPAVGVQRNRHVTAAGTLGTSFFN